MVVSPDANPPTAAPACTEGRGFRVWGVGSACGVCQGSTHHLSHHSAGLYTYIPVCVCIRSCTTTHINCRVGGLGYGPFFFHKGTHSTNEDTVNLIRASIRDKHSGSMKITTYLDHVGHCKTTSGTNWSNRWTYRVLITITRRF